MAFLLRHCKSILDMTRRTLMRFEYIESSTSFSVFVTVMLTKSGKLNYYVEYIIFFKQLTWASWSSTKCLWTCKSFNSCHGVFSIIVLLHPHCNAQTKVLEYIWVRFHNRLAISPGALSSQLIQRTKATAHSRVCNSGDFLKNCAISSKYTVECLAI